MNLSDSAAVLFDLDGVLTDTAVVHERAWARMFGEFFDTWPATSGPAPAPYVGADYFAYIDGKPRVDGVRSMLSSRGISIPEGTVDDPPAARTVAGLGNRKNELFEQDLREEGVRAYPGSVALLNWLDTHGVAMAVVSSSHNARAVLDAAGIRRYFTVVVDGTAAGRAGLAGKPAPATYLHAALLLTAAPGETVVVEDAISGVRAGRAGGFHVIGVDRGAGHDDLIGNGADLVVGDLADLVADP